jgi:ribosome-binding factor A
MTEGTRPDRVAEEFREILAEEIPRLKDPRVGFVTVTHVDVTGDLRRATVFYTAFGDDAAKRRTRAGLESATAHLRQALGQQVRMKFTPELEFEEDIGLTQVERVSELLRQIETESKKPGGDAKDAATAEPAAAAGSESAADRKDPAE